MHYLILLLFALCFTAGAFLLLAELLKVPTYKAAKAIISMGKRTKKQARSSDAFILELAVRLSKYLPMGEYKKRRLAGELKSAEIKMTAEVFMAQSVVKAGLVLLMVIPCLLIMPVVSPAFVIAGIAVYWGEAGKPRKLVQAKREGIECELPRFVATITQELIASRDVLSMLESYQPGAGKAMKSELSITIADMRTGNFEAALTRFEARISSAMLSDVVRGLIGVIRGDDGVVYFRMLSYDMKQIELGRLKRLAIERPPKIRKYSFMLLGCMLLVYMGIMAYEIAKTLSGML